MDVNPGYKHIEKFRSGTQWYMMESKDFISNNSWKLKNDNRNLVSINGQPITFERSFSEV